MIARPSSLLFRGDLHAGTAAAERAEEFERLLRPSITGMRSAVRVSDLGGGRDADGDSRSGSTAVLLDYLRDLEKTFVFALGTMLVALATITVAVIDFFWFMRIGVSFLHPWLDIFLALAAVAALAVAVASALVTKRYLKQTIRKISEGC